MKEILAVLFDFVQLNRPEAWFGLLLLVESKLSSSSSSESVPRLLMRLLLLLRSLGAMGGQEHTNKTACENIRTDRRQFGVVEE